jgi:putative MATE family efflux protein
MQKSIDLTTGSIIRNLISLSGPIILGMIFQSAYNVIDTIFIGMLGPNQLAAVSIMFPVVFIFMAMASGLSMGTTILVSQSIGADDLKRASNVAEHSMLLGIVVGIFVAVSGILFSEHLFLFLGADDKVLPLSIEYSTYIFIGFMFLFLGFIGQGILQAEGDSKTPFRCNVIAIALNIILDPILIFGLFGFPALGVVGAAIATVLSRSVGAALVLSFIWRGKAQTKIDLSPKYFRFDFGITRRIFSLGFPASLGNLIFSLGLLLMMSLVGSFGKYAIAAYGVGIRMNFIIMMPTMGIMSALVSITGQNIGAGKIERIEDTVKIAIIVISIVMTAFTVFLVSFPQLIFRIFTSEEEVIAIGVIYLRIISFRFVFRGIAMLFMAVLQGAGKTALSTIIIALNWIVVLLLSFFTGELYGLPAIWVSSLVGALFFSSSAFLLYQQRVWLK